MSNPSSISFDFELHPRQMEAFNSIATEILYGGAAGGGKSFLMRVFAIVWSLKIPGLLTYFFRRQSTDLEQNHIEGPSGFPILLSEMVKNGIAKISNEKNRINIKFCNGPNGSFEGGSRIFLRHCKDENDKYDYQGAEIHLLIIDELTHFTESMFRYLRGRVRMVGLRLPADVPPGLFPRVLCGTNPGGVGHYHVKHAFIDGHAPMEIWKTPKKEGGRLRQYIPARLEDNPTLMNDDPDYGDRLEGLGDPALVKAMREGDWDTFQGQAFPFSQNFHVVSPCPVPAHAQLYMTFDWGYGAPFSVGWWWVDADGRVFRFSEWYGWNGQPNQGMRMTDSEIASGIKEREDRLGIAARSIIRLAGPDCFSKKPDYLGGGQGPSTSEMFARQGVNLSPGDADRKKKIRQFHERLRVPKDGSAPMLQVYSTCTQFIRTIPTLVLDERNVEDLATNLEDHIYDEACHICMARPIEMVEPSSQKTNVQRMIEKWEEPETSDTLSVAGVYSEHYGEEERGVVNSIHGYDSPLGATNETWSFLQ